MTKQRWSKLRPWVALTVVGLYLAVLVVVVVSGGWHSPRVFSALYPVAALAMFVAAFSQLGAERVTGPREVRILRGTVVVLALVCLGVPAFIRMFAVPAFDPVSALLLHAMMLVSAVSLITGWTAPVPRAVPAA